MALSLRPGERQHVSVIAANGQQFMPPQSCKSYIGDALCAYFYPEYAGLWSVWNPHSGDRKPSGKLDLDKIQIATWTSAKTREKNAKKLAYLLNQIEECIGAEAKSETYCPNTGVSKNSAPIVVRAPGFWLKSPVTLDALILFARLSPRLRKKESLDKFQERMLDKGESKHQDCAYIRKAIHRGSFGMLLEHSLPCMNREGHSDYLLHHHARGFSWYHPESDDIYPKDEKSLKVLRIEGRKAELNRLNEEG